MSAELRPAWVGRQNAPAMTLAAALAAIACGAVVAALSPLGPAIQASIVLALGLGGPLLLLFLLRPGHALAAYLFALPLLVPVPIVLGLNAGEIVTLLVLMVGGLSIIRHGDRWVNSARRLSPILVPLVALIIVSLVSLLVNDLLRLEDVVSALFKFVAYSIMAMLVHVHAPDIGGTRILFGAAVCGAGAVAVYTLLAYLLGWSYSAEFDWNRPMGTFENWNLLGGFMALMAFPTLGLASSVRSAAARAALVAFFVLEVAALLLSLTLGAMLGLIVGAGLALFFVARIRLRGLLLPIMLVLGVGVAVFATTPLLRDKVSRVDERALDRLKTYATGVAMFRDNFWWGFGSEQNLTDAIWFGEADYDVTIFGASGMVPHNAWLKIAVEKGVFGAATFTMLIAGALLVLFRSRRQLSNGRHAYIFYGTAAGILACLVQNVTNDLLLHARVGTVFFCLIALVDRFAELEEAVPSLHVSTERPAAGAAT